MKKLITLCVIALFSVTCFAQTKSVTLAWDQDSAQDINTLNSIRIYNIAVTPEVLLGTALCTGVTPSVTCPSQLTLTITTGTQYSFVARNFDGIQESGNSNTVSTPGKPPKNLRK